MSSLEKLRRDAKALKRAHREGDPEARARVAAAMGPRETLIHADALHVIAREQGQASWPRLRFALEAAQLDRAQRAERLKAALFHGQHWAVDALIGADPTLGRADLGLACALYDADHVRAAIAEDPSVVQREVAGPRRPILHLAFSRHIHGAGRREDMLAVAETLVAAGADVNDGYPAEPGSPHMLSALYGALGHADNLALAAWLLERGASPDDNESLYHACELGHLEGLRLLIRHGVRTEGTNALPRMLDFDDLEGVRLLLEHGADPNEGMAPHPSGAPTQVIPALHQAARRMCSGEVAELLLAHGADGRAPYRGHTAFALARMCGNGAVAAALERAGQATPLDPVERLIAATAEGPVAGRIDLAALGETTREMLHWLLPYDGTLPQVQRLVGLGFDPDWTDGQGMPAIHIAGWEGQADAVAWLLGFEPDLTRKNVYGGDLMGTVIHGAEFCPKRDRRDHLRCARLVLEAGAPLHRADIEGCGVETMCALLEEWADARPESVI